MRSVITKHNPISNVNNIKTTLSYAIKHGSGYYNDLKNTDKTGGKIVEKFQTLGFINTGHTYKAETYGITRFGKQFYKEVFGFFDYLKTVIEGFISKKGA